MTRRPRFNLKIRDHLHAPEAKRAYNEQHFSEAASRYDIATRAMSLGRDRAWKRALVAALPQRPPARCVDLACGTGDIAFLLAERYPEAEVLGIDLTEPMLAIARKRNRFPEVTFRQGEMTATGLPAESVDVVTGGYAVRNAPDLRQAFLEIRRLLRPGGCAALLDFSKPVNRTAQRLQYALLRNWCGLWGLLLHGNPEIHSYIAASLSVYPDRPQLRRLLAEIGFSVELAQRFYFGVLELMVLKKPL
jgi:ubiquinone/menaquinone biosynthesis methyltransferase